MVLPWIAYKKNKKYQQKPTERLRKILKAHTTRRLWNPHNLNITNLLSTTRQKSENSEPQNRQRQTTLIISGALNQFYFFHSDTNGTSSRNSVSRPQVCIPLYCSCQKQSQRKCIILHWHCNAWTPALLQDRHLSCKVSFQYLQSPDDNNNNNNNKLIYIVL